MRKLYWAMIEVNTVNCGLFGISEDYQEQLLSLDQYLIERPNSTFFFRVAGDSMTPLLVEEDVLLVDRAKKPQSGSIIIAEYEGVLVCKVLRIREEAYTLYSLNGQYTEITIPRDQPLDVWGTVIGQVRKIT